MENCRVTSSIYISYFLVANMATSGSWIWALFGMTNIRNDSSTHSYVVPSFNHTNLAILHLLLSSDNIWKIMGFQALFSNWKPLFSDFLMEDCEDNNKIVLLYNSLPGLHWNKNFYHLQKSQNCSELSVLW